jgi:S-formylglutathione hydrolase FrmB
VGDVERGGVELLDDVADRRQHLDLGGHVERGGRLVEDDQVGPAGHGHRGHGALQLAARHLVRIAEADLFAGSADAGAL